MEINIVFYIHIKERLSFVIFYINSFWYENIVSDIKFRFLTLKPLITNTRNMPNKNINTSSFKSSGNIQKKESGPYRGFAY